MADQLRGLGAVRQIDRALALTHPDLKATNQREAPDAVVPRANPHVPVDGETLVARLPPASQNVIVTRSAAGRRSGCGATPGSTNRASGVMRCTWGV